MAEPPQQDSVELTSELIARLVKLSCLDIESKAIQDIVFTNKAGDVLPKIRAQRVIWPSEHNAAVQQVTVQAVVEAIKSKSPAVEDWSSNTFILHSGGIYPGEGDVAEIVPLIRPSDPLAKIAIHTREQKPVAIAWDYRAYVLEAGQCIRVMEGVIKFIVINCE